MHDQDESVVEAALRCAAGLATGLGNWKGFAFKGSVLLPSILEAAHRLRCPPLHPIHAAIDVLIDPVSPFSLLSPSLAPNGARAVLKAGVEPDPEPLVGLTETGSSAEAKDEVECGLKVSE